MTTRKQNSNAEPFLNVVARKIGRAAGTFTNVAQGFAENLTAVPNVVSAKIEPAEAGSSDRRHPKDTKKKIPSRPKARAARTAKTARKRGLAAEKSARASARSRKKK